MVYSRTGPVFILKHYFAPQSFAAASIAFSKAYPDMEEPYKTTIHRNADKNLKHRKCLRDKTCPTSDNVDRLHSQ
jgi:hypothetical protein